MIPSKIRSRPGIDEDPDLETLLPSKRFIASIQGKFVAEYLDRRLKEVAPNTVRHELAVLSHVFTVAVKECGLVNPVRQIRAPKMPPGEPEDFFPANRTESFPPPDRPFSPTSPDLPLQRA
uniref:Uncharacterized protein n=1 Tax=Leptospirillum ferriphilum TaxID=178606 RepID=A0A7C3QT07_9BACT